MRRRTFLLVCSLVTWCLLASHSISVGTSVEMRTYLGWLLPLSGGSGAMESWWLSTIRRMVGWHWPRVTFCQSEWLENMGPASFTDTCINVYLLLDALGCGVNWSTQDPLLPLLWTDWSSCYFGCSAEDDLASWALLVPLLWVDWPATATRYGCPC